MTDQKKPTFSLPQLFDSDLEWGPSALNSVSQFSSLPYAPFSKSDRIGKLADWSADAQSRQQNDNRKQNRRDHVFGASTENPFAFQNDEDGAFSLVDNKVVQKKTTFTRGARQPTRGAQRGNSRGGSFQRLGAGGRNQPQRTNNYAKSKRFGWRDYEKKTRDASIQVGADWEVVEEIELNRVAKLTHNVIEPTELSTHGQLSNYIKKFDKPTRADGMLRQTDTAKYNVTPSEDPILLEYSKSDDSLVYISDTILSLLLCSNRSVAPWDIIVNRVGDKLFFDKREGGPLDTITVNENAADPPVESGNDKDINTPSNLSLEALMVNQNFQAQVLDSNFKQLDKPNPFHDSSEEEALGSAAYIYRKFALDSVLNMIVRTEVDAMQKGADGQDKYVLVRALNEFDSKAPGAGDALDWRTKLDTQRGAVIATEMKNNNCKLTRWAVQAILANASQLKLGWVSRIHPKDNRRHQILTTMQYRPADFLNQMNFQFTTGWAIVYAIVRLCLQLEEGSYILVKDPNRPIIRLYSTPADAFEANDNETNQDLVDQE